MPHCENEAGEKSVSGSLGCGIAVHAEANAVAHAARLGIALGGAEMYTTLSPCVMCAMLVINAGLTTVYCAQIYRDPAGVDLLESAGIVVRSLTP
jgi:dCMP deaminase